MSLTSPVVFVVGRPGSGKSTVIARLSSKLQRLLGGSTPVHVVDEFDILRSLAETESCSSVKRNPDGSIEILDGEAVFANTIRELGREVISRRAERGVTLCEFAKSSYAPVFSEFDHTLLDAAWVLHVGAPLELCCERNEERRTQSPERHVPEGVLKGQYRSDDLDELANMFGTRLCMIQNGTDEIGELDNVIDDFLDRCADDIQLTKIAP